MQRFGRHSTFDAPEKNSPKQYTRTYSNNLTRRNAELPETMPSRRQSSCLMSANLNSLRLFRHICRLVPFILRICQLNHRVDPVQSKIYIANFFRDNANEKSLTRIDYLINYGYQTVYEAEMTYSNSGYLYRFMIPKTHRFKDFGIDKFYESRADRINKLPNSTFLDGFYRGKKSHVE